MNLRTTLILTIVLVALAVIISVTVLSTTTRKQELATPEKVDNSQALLTDVALRADALTLEPAGQPKISARRTLDEWRLEAPALSKGSMVWDTLFSNLKGLNYRRVFEPGSKDYPPDELTGLSKPRLVVRADYLRPSLYDAGPINDVAAKLGAPIQPPPEQAKARAVIRIGQRTSLGDATYLALGEPGAPGADKVYLVSGDVLANLRTELAELRDKNLLRGREQDLREVVIEPVGQPRIVLRRDAKDQWQLVEPTKGRLDNERFGVLLRQLNNIDAEEWLAETDPDVAAIQETFNPPRVKISLAATVGVVPIAGSQPATLPTKAVTLELGGFADLGKTKLYARLAGENGIARLRQFQVDKLAPSLNDLRSRSLIAPDTREIKTVRIESPKGRINLVQRDGQWELQEEANREPAEAPLVAELLGQLARLSVLQFVPPPASGPAASQPTVGLAKPEIKIELDYAGQPAPTVLKFGPADASGSFRPVQVNDEGPGLLSTMMADSLRLDQHHYLSRSIWTLDKNKLKAVRIKRPDGTHTLTRSAEGWRLAGPSAQLAGTDRVTPAAASALLNTLSELKAASILGSSSAPDLQFKDQEPQITIQVDVPGEKGSTGPEFPAATAPSTQASQPASQAASQPEAPPITMVLRLAQRDGRTLARIEGRPYVYEVNPQVWAQAEAELADRSLGLGEASQIKRIEVKPESGPAYALVRGADNVWKVEGNDLFPLDRARVEQLVADLAGAAAVKLSATAYEPGNKPVSVTVTSGTAVKTLEIGQAMDASVLARLTGRASPFLLERGPAANLTPPLKELALRTAPTTPTPEAPAGFPPGAPGQLPPGLPGGIPQE